MLGLAYLRWPIVRRSFPCLVSRKPFHSSQYVVQVRKRQEGLVVEKKSSFSELSLGEKVKETTKTTTYTGIIILGVGITLYIFYTIFQELFSKNSPNGIYNTASKKCLRDTRVSDALGEPITVHGEETGRGRRRHVSHIKYMKGGVEHIRMKFYLKGSRKLGECYLDAVKNSSGNYEFEVIILQINDLARNMIIIEDNRDKKIEPVEPSFLTL